VWAVLEAAPLGAGRKRENGEIEVKRGFVEGSVEGRVEVMLRRPEAKKVLLLC
jgi:hypothetical protein